ncbi:hypothetical protein FACS1894195_0390 [Bacteroidia bacterium]|nr:hypothetical protein FACS1894195_0390 [Bacteroidia bacterium]
MKNETFSYKGYVCRWDELHRHYFIYKQRKFKRRIINPVLNPEIIRHKKPPRPMKAFKTAEECREYIEWYEKDKKI